MELPKVLGDDVMWRGWSSFKEKQKSFIAKRLP
jgi:hypothetical protein